MSVEEKVCVRTIMAMVNYATKQILDMDPDFKNKIQGLNEKVMWKIGDDIVYTTTVKDGNIDGDFVEADDPTLVFKVTDAKVAIKALSATEETAGNFAKDVWVSDMKKAEDLSFMTTTVAEYLKGLRAEGG